MYRSKRSHDAKAESSGAAVEATANSRIHRRAMGSFFSTIINYGRRFLNIHPRTLVSSIDQRLTVRASLYICAINLALANLSRFVCSQ